MSAQGSGNMVRGWGGRAGCVMGVGVWMADAWWRYQCISK